MSPVFLPPDFLSTPGWPWSGWLFRAGLAFVIGFSYFEVERSLPGHALSFRHYPIIIFNETVGWTGGPSGLSGIPNLHIGSLFFDNDRNTYYLIWIFTLGVMLLSITLSQSRIGRALRAIHDSEVAAALWGQCRFLKYRYLRYPPFYPLSREAFTPYHDLYSPVAFGFNFSVEFGTMSLSADSAVLWFLPGRGHLNPAAGMLRVFQDFDIVIYGLMLILITMYMPGGLISGLDRVTRMITRKIKGHQSDA